MRTVPAMVELVPAFLARMDAEERADLTALTGDPVAALARLIAASPVTWCGLDAEGPVDVGGVKPVDAAGTGYFWQVISPAALADKRAYLEQGRAVQRMTDAAFARVVSLIDASYPAALRHARRFGFTVHPPRHMAGRMACLCERTRPCGS